MFKFSSISFSEGSLGFQSGADAAWIALLLLLLGVGLLLIYRQTRQYRRPRDRATSAGLRSAALLLLFLPLFEPVLVIPEIVPDETFVAVLVDASESMNIADVSGASTRHEAVRRTLVDTGLDRGLRAHFKMRYYGFGERPARADTVASIVSDQERTDLYEALGQVSADFRGLPLSGVVLLSDGAHNGNGAPLDAAEAFAAAEIPVHVIGFGEDELTDDRELVRVRVHRGVERATDAEIDVTVRSWRSGRDEVTLNLFSADQVVLSERRTLKGGGRVDHFTLFYEPRDTAPREYRLEVEPAASERNTRNNEAELLINPRDDTLRVLMIEGHPRRDFKFLKRALEDDRSVQVSSILRTGTGKFYRQGIRSADELAGGFPRDESELFRYHVVLLGDIESSHFALEQLEMLRQFVRRRGGGLAMLGGRASFAEGAYWSNALADVLPVAIDPSRRTVIPPVFDSGDPEAPPSDRGFQFLPTRAGLESPILRLAADPDQNRTLWESMPGLTSINYLGSPRAGATVLAEKPDDAFGSAEPLLVVQRYGKGRTAALATASTWRWQMLADASDHRHARFWRQFVRWLAASAPGRVEITLEGERFTPNQEIRARVEVFDERFTPVDQVSVEASLQDESGRDIPVAFRPELGSPGVFTASLLPSGEGMHTVQVEVQMEDGTRHRDEHVFLVRPDRREFQNVAQNRALLQALAEATGGRYYEPDEAGSLPERLRGSRTSTSVYNASYLWDMPAFFLLILGLLAGEWAWRRRRNLP